MHAEVFTDSELRQKLNDNFILAYVDIESGDRIRLENGERITEMQFSTRNRIYGTPTFVFLSPQRKALFVKAGFQSIVQMTRYHNFIYESAYLTSSLEDYLSQQ